MPDDEHESCESSHRYWRSTGWEYCPECGETFDDGGDE